MTPSGVNELKRELAIISADTIVPEPPFRFQIGWSDTYDDLLGANSRKLTSIEELLVQASRRGRVILHAEGGGGKSSIINRLFRKRVQNGNIAVLIDLRSWTPPLFQLWDAWRANDVMRMQLLFNHLSRPRVSEGELGALPVRHMRFVFVDGLNELPASVGQSILECLDSYARRNPMCAVLVTDRLVRRSVPSEDWGLARVESLSHREIARVLKQTSGAPSSERLLGMPFFLDLAIKKGMDSTSGSGAFRDYFRNHVGLTVAQIESAANAAFLAYSTQQVRTFDLEWFSETAGADTTEKLVQSGTLVATNESAYFRHHLFHDYLASEWMSMHPSTWTNSVFDSLTFRASSFDVLGLGLEQLSDSRSADAFLRKVYDWHFFGSAYALSKGRLLGSVKVSQEMETALLAMYAERRWDPIRYTAAWVTDALNLFPSSLAKQFLQATDVTEVINLVRKITPGSSQFEEWRALFTIAHGSSVSDEIVEMIRNSDSLLGWTAANVLKRVRLGQSQITTLLTFLRTEGEPSATTRWRAAHTLGAHPSERGVHALLESLGDKDSWVRYGAIRSLVENAARSSPAVRDLVFSGIRERIQTVVEDERTLEELERTLLLADPPSGWADAVEPVLEELWATAKTLERQDHWRRLAYKVQRVAAGRS